MDQAQLNSLTNFIWNIADDVQQLEIEFGRGFGEKSLRHMFRFTEALLDWAIVSTLSGQSAPSHFMEIIFLKIDL